MESPFSHFPSRKLQSETNFSFVGEKRMGGLFFVKTSYQIQSHLRSSPVMAGHRQSESLLTAFYRLVLYLDNAPNESKPTLKLVFFFKRENIVTSTCHSFAALDCYDREFASITVLYTKKRKVQTCCPAVLLKSSASYLRLLVEFGSVHRPLLSFCSSSSSRVLLTVGLKC